MNGLHFKLDDKRAVIAYGIVDAMIIDVVKVHLKLGHKSAAVPNVHHHCLHPSVFSQLPVKGGCHCHYHHHYYHR